MGFTAQTGSLAATKPLSGSQTLTIIYSTWTRFASLSSIQSKGISKGRIGQYSCNPLGKNPGDVWVIPNVEHNHVEKTSHPCQFPIELVERLVLALTNKGDLVIDPYMGVGSSACAAVMHGRRAAGSDLSEEYISIAKDRVEQAKLGFLQRRPLGKEVYVPGPK